MAGYVIDNMPKLTVSQMNAPTGRTHANGPLGEPPCTGIRASIRRANGIIDIRKMISPPPTKEKNLREYQEKTPSAFVPSLSAISRPIPKSAPMETKNGIRSGNITSMPTPKSIAAAPLPVSMSGAS